MSIDLPAIIKQCAPNVALITMQKLINVESSQRPHAIGYKVIGKNGAVYRLERSPADINQAIRWAKWLIARGYQFDAGIAQINSAHFTTYGLSAESAFDLCTNISTGAQILTACFERAKARFPTEQSALQAALSCYNSGNFSSGFSNGYVQRVLSAAPVSLKVSDASHPTLKQTAAALRAYPKSSRAGARQGGPGLANATETGAYIDISEDFEHRPTQYGARAVNCGQALRRTSRKACPITENAMLAPTEVKGFSTLGERLR